MLEISLERAVCAAGREAGLVVLLRNPTVAPISNIRLRLALPASILLVGGESIVLERLPAGETTRHILRVTPQQPGEWAITSPNCSFRDALGATHRITDMRLPLHVVAAPALRPPAAPPSTAAIQLIRQRIRNTEKTLLRLEQQKGILAEQQATFGAYSPPAVIIQLTNIQRQVGDLEAELARLRAQLGE